MTLAIIPKIVQPTENRIPIRATLIKAEERFSSCHFFVNTIAEKKRWTKKMNPIIINQLLEILAL